MTRKTTPLVALLLMGCLEPPEPQSETVPAMNHESASVRDARFDSCDHTGIDAMLAELVDSPFVGCAVAVADSEGVIYAAAEGHAAYGSACTGGGDDRDFTIDTAANVGSVSKTITAVALMKLWEEGYIEADGRTALDELTIGDFLDIESTPAVPGWVADVTLHDTLSHQGFNDEVTEPVVDEETYEVTYVPLWKQINDFDGAEPVLVSLMSEEEPSWSAISPALATLLEGQAAAQLEHVTDTGANPGSSPLLAINLLSGPDEPPLITDYSNIGYAFLAAIIDSIVTDPDFDGFGDYDGERGYESYVWWVWNSGGQAPLGPTSMALIHPWREGSIPELAEAHETVNTETCDAVDGWIFPGWESGAGGWTMTVGDLARVGMVVYSETILEPDTWALMKTNHSGVRGGYGYGLMVESESNPVGDVYGEFVTDTVQGHSGISPGFHAGTFAFSSDEPENTEALLGVAAYMCNSLGSGEGEGVDADVIKAYTADVAVAWDGADPLCYSSGVKPKGALSWYWEGVEAELIDLSARYSSREIESMLRDELSADKTGAALLRHLDAGSYDAATACALVWLGDDSGRWSCR